MKRDSIRFRKANPIHITGIMRSVVNDLGIGPDIFLNRIKDNWKEIVGAANAKNTRPVSFNNGKLTIAVSSPVWMTQALFYKSSFMEKISKFISTNNVEILDIRFILESY